MQGVGNVSLFMNFVKARLQDNFVQTWHSELTESTRALTHRSLASSFDSKLYLDNIKVEIHRNVSLYIPYVTVHKIYILKQNGTRLQ
jgi:hypothetical protein